MLRNGGVGEGGKGGGKPKVRDATALAARLHSPRCGPDTSRDAPMRRMYSEVILSKRTCALIK